jgi:hypothetical protein
MIPIPAAREGISEGYAEFYGFGAALQSNETRRFGQPFSEGVIYDPAGTTGRFISKTSCVRQ